MVAAATVNLSLVLDIDYSFIVIKKNSAFPDTNFSPAILPTLLRAVK
jgi:hypothetical protein